MKSMRTSVNREDRDSETRTSTFIKIVYTVFVLNVLAFALLLFGLIAGWFGFSGDRMNDGTYRFGLVFDSEEVGDDIGETMNAANNLTETAKSATALETYDGVIKLLDREQNQVVLTSEGQDYEVGLTDATEYEGDELISFGSLQVGDQVRLTVQEKNKRLFAVKIKKEVIETAK